MTEPVSHTTNNSPATDDQAKQEPSPLPVKTTVSEYVINWKWFVAGILALLIGGGSLGGLYYLRTTRLSKDILGVVERMRNEADELRRKAGDLDNSNGDSKDIEDLRMKSYKMRVDAVDLLRSFARRPNQENNAKVLTEINELLEGLLSDERGSPPLANRRRSEIMENCKQLIRAIASEEESFRYQLRLMELEWEQGNMGGVLDRAKTVLQFDKKRGRENYDALRYITLVTMSRLATEDYRRIQAQLQLPETMDKLLDKVLQLRPDNIEIAYRYAEFVSDVNNREEFKKVASEGLYRLAQGERDRMAMTALNEMVSRNKDNVRAYLIRYNFKKRYLKTPDDPDKLDPDIETILEINPNDPDGLILAGLTTFRQSLVARNEGNIEVADAKRVQAEEYLKRVIEKNPRADLGYQHLGDFYAARGNEDEAIRVWNQGVEQRIPMVNPELIGRLVSALINQKKYEDAAAKVDLLRRYVQEIRQTAQPDYLRQVQNLSALLTARLYAAEGAEAVEKAEKARMEGRLQESQNLFAVAQQKTSGATKLLSDKLLNFGAPHDYVVDGASIYAKLLGDSLLLAGRLMSDQAKWSQAAQYYEKAKPFPAFTQRALVLEAAAYQQMHRQEDAIRCLRDARDNDPDNPTYQFLYAQSLYRREVGRKVPSVSDINYVEQQFVQLQEKAAEVPNPWMIDIRLIHLEMARENASNDPDRIQKAFRDAVQKFKALESKEFPLPEGTEPAPGEKHRTYSDDIGFLAEMAGIYSSLGQISDFDNILQKMRSLPNGEVMYYSELISDAIRRNDKDSAVLAIEEALESTILNQTQKQRFVAILQNLKDESSTAMERIYKQLQTTFDQNPNSLKPQALFLLANMALDREDFQKAETLIGLLKTRESEPATMWRYLAARQKMLQKTPDFEGAKAIQAEIEAIDPGWDMGFLLKAAIDEELYRQKDDPQIRDRIIGAYQMAIQNGCVQRDVWNRLMSLYRETGRDEDIRKLRRDAIVRGVTMEATGSQQFPAPYQKMYEQVHASLESDPKEADLIARQCLVLAEGRRESPDLLFSLNLEFGKMFLDANMTRSAMRHLRHVANRGGSYVYPLAVALAKDKQIDEGFNLILDEIERTPSSMGTLVPAILVLLSQVRPSEAVFERLDKLMTSIENGERPVLRATVRQTNPDGHLIDLKVPRRIVTMLVRFPNNEEILPLDDFQVFPPDEEEDENDDSENTAVEE